MQRKLDSYQDQSRVHSTFFWSVKAHGIRRECHTALLQFMLTWSKLSDDDGNDENCFALLFADVMRSRESLNHGFLP